MSGALNVRLSPPPPVVTIGLHGSASTWVFNVVRELVAASNADRRVLSLFAEQMGQLPDEATREASRLVIKSHQPSEELMGWLEAKKAVFVLSARDPRDACMSMTLRFKAPLNATIGWIAADCRRLSALARNGHPVLRYEDRFFEQSANVGRIAAHLGLSPAADLAQDIFNRYRTDAVRSLAQGLKDRPPEEVGMVTQFRIDRETQILEPHIGDTLSGKWRDLPEDVQIKLTNFFAPFLDQFGYPH